MASVILRKMSEKEFHDWKIQSEQNYALDKEKEGYSKADALALSQKSFQTLLPQGIETPNQHLYRIVDSSSLDPVGILWWGIQKQGAQDLPWIYDISVEEKFQGKGYGRAAMLQAEIDVKKNGYQRLGLHVFGHNTKARSLYESLSFRTTNVVMQKDLN